jgi:DNA-binding MarR family transcriptional regulator
MSTQLSQQLIHFGSQFDMLSHSLFKVIQPNDLTPVQFEMLKYFAYNTDVTLSKLADCLDMNIPNTSREVKKLVEKNLLKKRVSDTDKRVVYVEISETGQALMYKLIGELDALICERYAHLNEADLKKMEKALEILNGLLFI